MILRPLFRWTLSLAAAGAFITAGYSAPADSPENALPAKRMVKSVEVVVSGAPVDANRIRANMATREGGPFSDETVERDIKNLYATGLVDSVDISTQDVAGGVRVVVKVGGRGIVGDVEFVGNSVVESKKLKSEVELKVGQSVDETKLFAGQNKIREMYAKKGFADVNVTYASQPMPDKKGFVRVVYTITEGQRNIINAIRFEGLTALSAKKLSAKMKLKVKHFYNLWGKAGKMDNEMLQTDVRAIERAIQDEGYVYARVLQVRREPVKDDRVDLVFVIEEGKRYAVSEVALDGNTVFTKEELAPALLTASGKAYSASNISDDEKMIGDYYGSRGYADARVETSVIQAGKDSVKIVFRVAEGEKSVVRMINIAGNEKTKDHVIRREVTVAPGDDYNTVRIEKTRNRLKQMGYFSVVDIRPSPTGTPGYKDIQIDVKEQSTGSLNLGVGFSSIDSLSGFFDLTETNFDITGWKNRFKGGGQRANIHIQAGNETRDFGVSLTEPWFLGKRLSLGGKLFYRDLLYLSPNDEYNQREYGGSIALRKPIGEHAYADLSYTLQNVEIYDIAADASPEIQAEKGKYLESKLSLSVAHDTRDSLTITRSGHRIEVGGDVIGMFLGGDVDVLGAHATASQFFTLPGDIILSVSGSANTISNEGDSANSPIFTRLFLGGATNLRGFEFRDVGPKDSTGEPLGGDTSYWGSVELDFPILGERDDPKLRGAVFYDVGKVTGGPGTFGGGLNANVGVGMRIFLLPGTPIRIDVGFPTKSDEFNDNGARFNFQLGYRF